MFSRVEQEISFITPGPEFNVLQNYFDRSRFSKLLRFKLPRAQTNRCLCNFPCSGVVYLSLNKDGENK